MFHKVKNKTIAKNRKKVVILMLLVLILGLSFALLFPNKKSLTENKEKAQKPFNFVDARKKWKKIVASSNDLKLVYRQFLDETKSIERGNQHLLAHVLGDLMYDKVGAKAITICDSSYTYGCYHGVATTAIAEEGLKEVKFLNSFCKSLKAEQIVACQHGIGHGLMEFFEHRADKLNIALHACDETYKGSEDLLFFGCSSGVFMEFNHPIVIKENEVVMDTRPVSTEGLYYPCALVDKEYQSSCYHSLAQWWARSDERNYKRLGDLCEPTIDKTNYFGCYRGIGNIIAPESDFDATESKKRCETLTSTKGQSYCKQAASLLFYGQSDLTKKRYVICDGLSSIDKDDCLFPKPMR